MKNSLLILLFLGLTSFAFVKIPNNKIDKAQETNTLTWQTSYDDAVKLAKKRNLYSFSLPEVIGVVHVKCYMPIYLKMKSLLH